jgi:acetyl-CoA synthetase
MDEYEVIPKNPELASQHVVVDYDTTCTAFSWEEAREQLDGLPDGALNIAHEAVDRHAESGHADRTAIRWLGADGTTEAISYADLSRLTNRFAHALESLGVDRGDRLFMLMGRVPALYIAMLGTLKHGAVFSPLFSAFGPEPIRQRVESGDGRVLVTTEELYREKVAEMRTDLPALEHVILVGPRDHPTNVEGTHDFWTLMDAASDAPRMAHTQPDDMALLHFTSGTTGKPKGAVHVHGAVLSHHVTGQFALDLKAGDVFWCTADPGWVTGTSYGIISPLTNAATMIIDEGDFGARRWYEILQNHTVDVWYTAPTAVRMLMKAGAEVAADYDLSHLRFIASVGEPLNPEAVVWAVEALGQPIHDNWWQTETGGIMIANYATMPIKPGSMGKPMPGIEAAILPTDARGEPPFDEPGEEGELALKVGWPSMFRAYLHRPDKYENSFDGEWYRSGDIAYRDADGYFWFVGRADDLIKSAGHLIGPFEVESALIEHPAVAEAGVIGVPHPVAGEIVKAFVTLNPNYEDDKSTRRDLKKFARERLGTAVAPRAIVIVDKLPKTRSGKIMRRLLKARELGLPEGDTSTLENGS